jgi:hypothetical protein
MESIRAAIDTGKLPPDRLHLRPPLLEDTGVYVAEEGILWDFKRQWPVSYSDDYFAGIARLICAFANTIGGIIIFGVHDESRTPIDVGEKMLAERPPFLASDRSADT